MGLREIDWAKWYQTVPNSVTGIERAYSPARLLDALGEHLPSFRGARILELGCAPGRWLAWAEKRLGAWPVGVELALEGIRLARSLYPNLALIRGTATLLPLREQTFDAVYSIGLIEHFEDPSPIVREARRVLRDGGTSIWIVPNLINGSICRWHWTTFRRENFEAHRVYTLDAIAQLLEGEGFRVVHQEYNGLYIPHLQRVMGRLPFRRHLRRFETGSLASNLVVVASRDSASRVPR